MSSSNLVKVTLIEESVYGETPGAGNFKTMRFTSEALSGTPETTESQQIRTDRLSSGQIVTGLTVGGETNHELAKEDVIDLLMASAMNSNWVDQSAVAVDMDIDNTAKTLTRGTGSFLTDGVVVGDLLKLTGFTASGNNTQVMVVAVTALEITYVGPDGMADEVGSGTSYEVADKIEIGTTQKSFSMQKEFTDLTTKAIVYKGMIVASMSLSASYGNIVTTNFTFSGNAYDPVDQAAEFITDGRVVDAPATTNSLNGSIDMPFLVTQDGAVIGEANFCIQSVEINLNNNLTPQTCIGESAPRSYNLGTALPEVTLSAYLDDQNFSYLQKKLTQESVAIGFMVKNAGGYYAVYMPAVQLSFDDPASPGQNQDVIMSMSGVAKVGDNNEKSMVIYRS